MRKIITLTFLALSVSVSFAVAQNNELSTATQSAKLVMSNAIEITFNSNGNSEGETINMAFDNVNDYANGVESAPIQLKVRSNKKFNVWAKATSNKFSYSGSMSPAPQMNVNKLSIKVVSNNTGGNVPNNVNGKYKKMSKSNRKLINNGTPGGNNTFSVQYKADPGFEFPAGTYSVDIVYTATQK
ncbi:MAG: hypothetical protein H6550_12025 [Chitinophagales bacterium]|nr:hypothetical protein [Chitinophagales bacterium]